MNPLAALADVLGFIAVADKCHCGGRGWYERWVDDPSDKMMGGYSDGEVYCVCPWGRRLRDRE